MSASKVAVLLVVTCVVLSTACGGIFYNRLEVSCPNMVTREEWGARQPQGDMVPLAVSPAPFIVIHHGGTPTYCTTQAECSKIVRSYQKYHMDTHGWSDIGYNFLVGEDGNVYEGRGWQHTGAHAPPFNNQSIGVCVIGDFSDRLPNDAAMRALQELIACGANMEVVSPEYGLLGHRQARPTLCPGNTFYKYVVTMPHWVPHPVPVAPQSPATTTTSTPQPSVNYV